MSALRPDNLLAFTGMIFVLACLGLAGVQGLDHQLILTICGLALICIFTAYLMVVRFRQRFQQRLLRRMSHRMHQICLARDAALAANLAKSTYFANTSHEIRTPMNGVLGMIDVLLDTPLNADQKTYAEVMRESCCDLLAMLNDVLDFAKLDAGKLEIEDIAFDLAATVQRVVLLMLPQAKEKGLTLDVEIDPALTGSFLGDPARIRQILLNLIGNAVKFTHSGGVRVQISRDDIDGQAIMRFAVRDSGCGIPLEGQSRLFREFSQLGPAVSRTHGGSGLGLAICRMLTEHMHGKIGCESRVGKGSTFWFTLPLRPGAIALPPPASGSGEKNSEVLVEAAPRHILLAEDNRANQIFMHSLLTRMGHQVDVVENGACAVSAVRKGRYDCVLMDLQMPGIGGLAAAQQIRALPPPGNQVVIVGLSADATGETRENVRNAGMQAFLIKPVSAEDLRQVLSRHAVRQGPGRATVLPVSLPVLDFHQLEELEAVLPEASLTELISMFLSEAAQFLGAMEQSRRAGNLTEAGHIAHQLVSMAGNLGAKEMSVLARRLEHACAEGDTEKADLLARSLSAASAKATAALAARHRVHEPREAGLSAGGA